MSITKYDTQEEKLRMQNRAESLKPKVATVVATIRGWEMPQSKGTMELLVSFPGLDSLLGDISPDPVIVPVVDPVAIKKPGPKPKVKLVADPVSVGE